MIRSVVVGLRLTVLIALLTSTSCGFSDRSHKEAEALYLLEALRQIQALSGGALPESHPLFHHLEIYTHDSYGLPAGQRYVWFSMRPKTTPVMQKGEISGKDAGDSFAGFFLIIDEKRKILDFGWHKP